ncbi:hypothetical protein E2C01_047782 [Portunus trituberculatus]|uniref:Uncharacterized protein n=1 Tax=Portunus trituberculatus TaxID=210409 RepID=A0A5B7G8E4_PORTR|nr:hypothetical protein [Portunus trituberculatus]
MKAGDAGAHARPGGEPHLRPRHVHTAHATRSRHAPTAQPRPGRKGKVLKENTLSIHQKR